ncbi:hypothetical protein PFICI_05833 [Pestalotiopsis fici W106-1]|uniref:Zn(2)-C6 fungal-type domain-containing protein n=1 Tax=Pestalotiopsis fici (strain W106-1 / CGMCC3.15140) TaxID=1229662 RepID=W3XEW3_PESFW|nr:uncharacterized protein PFICI_05833 [Pestalotiopsis fici W106-1]ETS83957.1 hypothetical protein PFICI_05833 [Pestalotiopsis fici W106-1]
MVGVPGRSQGCITCRSRKKGCDGQRPACLRCIQAGLQCGGYSRHPVFIASTPDSQGNLATYTRATPALTASSHTSQSSSAQDVTLSQSLTQTAYNARYMDMFWSHYLPCGETLTNEAMKLGNGGWINLALDLFSTDSTLQLAMQSVVLRGMGMRNADQSLMRQGSAAYSMCLKDFNKALSDSGRRSTDGILCTVKLLSLFEMHYGADETDKLAQQRSWGAHANGQLAMLTLREPQDFRSGKAHQLFVDYRYNLIISAIVERKRFVLDGKGWNTKPWKSIRKSPRDKLLDILSELCQVLEEVDHMQACTKLDEKTVLRQDILRRCWRLDELLRAWTNETTKLKNFEHDHSLEPKDPQDFALAHLTILYWATGALVHANLFALVDKDDALPPRINPLIFVHKVASAMPFFLHPRAGAMGPKIASFPLGMALQVYYGMEDEPSEDIDIFAGFTESGFDATAIVNFILSMQRGYVKTEVADRGGLQGTRTLAKAWMNLSGV